jgi:hypothetical protein
LRDALADVEASYEALADFLKRLRLRIKARHSLKFIWAYGKAEPYRTEGGKAGNTVLNAITASAGILDSHVLHF